MPNTNVPTNASFMPETRIGRVKAQLDKLEGMAHATEPVPKLDRFDSETEELLISLYGKGHKHVEAYKYASLGEAEAMVNLPESAQEPLANDMPKKAVQQRRQVLLGVLSDLEDMDGIEQEALAGEDHEDPPGIS